MASLFAGMPTCPFSLTAQLLTYLSDIFAFSAAMTGLPAVMRTTFQLLGTDFAAANICEPAWLVLKSLLLTHADLLHQIWALWTEFLISMAVV